MADSYTILNAIGSGGFGTVHRATVNSTGQQVALKVLTEPYDNEDVERFRREVRLQTLLEHRNIVKVFNDRLDETPPSFAMPLAEGNLEEYLATQGCGEKSVGVMYDICDAISYAHANNVIHRDLSARNVLYYVDSSGEFFMAVADFGLGRQLDSHSARLTRTIQQFGTPGYIAPEQTAALGAASRLSDVYSLGKLLYQVLSGRTPYPDMDFDLIPAQYSYVVRHATAPRPESRYQSVDELLADLDRVVQRNVTVADPAAELGVLLEDATSNTGRLKTLISENLGDTAFLSKVVPSIDRETLDTFLETDIDFVRAVFAAFDKAVSVGLPFEYCDVVGRTLLRLVEATEDVELRLLALTRLVEVADYHNRWYVRDIVDGIAQRHDEPSILMPLRDILQHTDRPEFFADAVTALTNKGYTV